MRTLIVLILCVFAFNFLSAQQNELALLDFESTEPKNHLFNNNLYSPTTTNSGYVEVSSSTELSNIIKSWKNRLANYNLKNNPIFDDSEKANYQVTYKNEQVNILAIYNHKGKLLSTKETYKNIKLPLALMINISKAYPKYAFIKNTYHCKYNHKTGVGKSYYVIQISDGKHKKTIKRDESLKNS